MQMKQKQTNKQTRKKQTSLGRITVWIFPMWVSLLFQEEKILEGKVTSSPAAPPFPWLFDAGGI